VLSKRFCATHRHKHSSAIDYKEKAISTVKVLETDRLMLRKLSVEDAPFILKLVNEPSFLRFIGDKGVRTLDEARDYILEGPVDSYDRLGFGLYMVESKENGTAIGMCGLIKRETLEDVDIGYAFLPEFWGKGYAFEAAAAVMEFGKSAFGLERIVAVVSTENYSSIKVLEKIGLRFERMVRLFEGDEEIKLFSPADGTNLSNVC
jgi:RimJ/RimL family protein N-acetyltransferase